MNTPLHNPNVSRKPPEFMTKPRALVNPLLNQAIVPKQSPPVPKQSNPGLVAIYEVLKARIIGLESELVALNKTMSTLEQAMNGNTPKIETPVYNPPPANILDGSTPVMSQIMEAYPTLDPGVIGDILTLVENSYS